MTTTTDATLQKLVDRNEITDLVHRLGVTLDEGHFDDMRSLLVEDATVRTPGGMAEGRDAVIAQARRNHRPEQPSQHVITNLLIDHDGDRAHARANLVVAFGPLASATVSERPLELPVEYTAGQVYGFDLLRTPGGWRFSGIETTPLWTSGTPIRPPQPN
jgi:hypothetical protein